MVVLRGEYELLIMMDSYALTISHCEVPNTRIIASSYKVDVSTILYEFKTTLYSGDLFRLFEVLAKEVTSSDQVINIVRICSEYEALFLSD